MVDEAVVKGILLRKWFPGKVPPGACWSDVARRSVAGAAQRQKH